MTYKVITQYGAWDTRKTLPAARRLAKAESKVGGRVCIFTITEPGGYRNSPGGARRTFEKRKQIACYKNGRASR